MTEADPIPDAYPDFAYDDDVEIAVAAPRTLRSRPAPSRSPRQGLLGVAEKRLLTLAEDGKSEVVRSFDGLVIMAQELAARIDSVGGGAVGGYAHQAAELIGDLQTMLRDKPVDELLDDGRELVRQSPGVAVGVAFIAGFLAARLVKSGSR